MQCSFCKAEVERGTGLVYIRKDGTMHPFCSHKCRKNSLKLRRNPRNLKWVRETKAGTGEKMFEKVKTTARAAS